MDIRYWILHIHNCIVDIRNCNDIHNAIMNICNLSGSISAIELWISIIQFLYIYAWIIYIHDNEYTVMNIHNP